MLLRGLRLFRPFRKLRSPTYNAARSAVEPLERRTLLSAGDLDPTFGAGGKALLSASAGSINYRVNAIAAQKDGKTLLAGSAGTSDNGNMGQFFLERLNAIPRWQVGSWGRWDDATRWLSNLHDIAPLPDESPIVRYDVGFYEQWFERATSGARGGLDELEPAYRSAMKLLAEAPPSLIHGEYYPSNVLVRAHEEQSICPIDFELFGVGSAALDLAALVTGLPERVARRVVSTYLRARSVPPDPARLDLLLLCARFHLAIRWLGWSSNWTPPRQHATDWAREARRAANALEAVT